MPTSFAPPSHHRPLAGVPADAARGEAARWLRWERKAGVILLLLSIAGGCASSDYLQARSSPRNPLNSQLQLLSRSGPHATQRTSRLLRRYALEDNDGNTDAVLQRLAEEITREPKSEKVYAYAELAYIGGRQAQEKGDDAQALKLYGGSVMHSFMYLFDPQFDLERNPYDPQFRGACDLYNGALEGALRLVAKQGKLKPGAIQHVKFGDKDAGLRLVVNGPWHDDEFERFEFVSDFEIKGLNNRHHSYGLGVPMIAVRRRHVNEASYEEHYPPGLSFAVTAFLRLRPGQQGEPHRMCTIELFDALDTQTANVGDYLVPLETDLSTALAYSLDRPEFREKQQLATTGFLDPNKGKKAQGLYMLEPYDENKIPVLMVHGLWSDPLTWMEMFNDLRSFPELRSRYQFWFYLYPTGQPFWVSATQLRDDLASLQSKLDPSSKNPALGQMVLVGHSMGGLVSRMQVINSEERLRELISEKPLDQVKLSDDEREHIRKVVYFRPNPAVKRVVSIGTPYRGSNFANDYTRWLSRKLITVPKRMVQAQQRLLNLDGLQNSELLRITTSIDSLAPSSPILKPLRESPAAPWVTTHNIVGVVSENGFIGRFAGESDGVVDRTSAHFEQAKTELVVEADHTTIHQNPRAILEVRRILLEHLETADYQLARVPFPSGAPAIAPPPIEMGSEPHEHH